MCRLKLDRLTKILKESAQTAHVENTTSVSKQDLHQVLFPARPFRESVQDIQPFEKKKKKKRVEHAITLGRSQQTSHDADA